MPFTPLWENPPDFVNAEGVEWWQHKSLTRHAHRSKMPELTVWVVRFPSSLMEFVVMKDSKIIRSDKSSEGIAVYIDLLSAHKHMK